MDEDGEIAHSMGNLVGGNGEGREQSEREARQECGGDQHAIQGVMDAVANDHECAGGRSAGVMAMAVVDMGFAMMVVVVAMFVVMMSVRLSGRAVAAGIVAVGMRVPPQHELLDNEEDSEADKRGDTN